MKFDTKYIIIIAIFGIILLYSYYYFFKSFKEPTKLWGRIQGNFLYIYYISMLLSTIGFLFLFYYLIISNSFTIDEINKLYYSLIFILVISMFWMPVSIDYIKNYKRMKSMINHVENENYIETKPKNNLNIYNKQIEIIQLEMEILQKQLSIKKLEMEILQKQLLIKKLELEILHP